MHTDIDTLVLEHATQAARRSPCHGPRHWRQVAQMGLALCQAGSGADPAVVLAFAALHDTKRWNDYSDPDHGVRAAKLAVNLVWRGQLELAPTQVQMLKHALLFHSRPVTSRDPTVGTCWDADRFTLWRVGCTPRVGGFSTLPALEEFFFFQRLGLHTVINRGPGWGSIIDEYKELT